MNEIEKLYYLLTAYCKGNYKTSTFTGLFTVKFDQKTDYSKLTDIENSYFHELSIITARYSPFEEDFINYPNVYFTNEQVRKKAEEVKSILLSDGN